MTIEPTAIENEAHALRAELTAIHHALVGFVHERPPPSERDQADLVDLGILADRGAQRADRIIALAYGKEPKPLDV